jgi:molybdopterin synthase catalytic subunit
MLEYEKEKNMICSVCKEYNIESDNMNDILTKIKHRLGELYTLIMFSYGQNCGGNYRFYGIFHNNSTNREVRVDFI